MLALREEERPQPAVELRVLRRGERAAAECVLREVREAEAGVKGIIRFAYRLNSAYYSRVDGAHIQLGNWLGGISSTYRGAPEGRGYCAKLVSRTRHK